MINVVGGLRKFGSVVFASTCTPAAFHAYKSMEVTALGDWREACLTAVCVGGFILLIFGLAGALSFGSKTDGDILENFRGGLFGSFQTSLGAAYAGICAARFHSHETQFPENRREAR